MTRIEQLRAQRKALIENARKILDGAEKAGREMTAEEDAEFGRMHDEADGLWTQIETEEKKLQARAVMAQRQQQAEASLEALRDPTNPLNRLPGSAAPADGGQQGAASDEDRVLAVQGWFLANSARGGVSDRHRDAADRCGISLERGSELVLNLHSNYPTLRNHLQNALRSNVPASGGALRLGEMLGPLEQAMLTYGPMLAVSDVLRTTHGNPLPWPTANDTTNTGRQIGESKPVASKDPTFGARVWNAYKFTSDEVLVPFELIRDTPLNLVQILGAMLGERLGRIINTKATTGHGAATMFGIVPRSVLGKAAVGASAIAADELIDLQDSVPVAYRPGAAFMMRDSTRSAIRKLKDLENRYLWEQSLQLGVPDKLVSWNLHINDDMATIATGQRTVLAGNFSYYKLRQVNTIRIYRLTERHRENDQDAFLAFTEADGDLLDPGTGPIRHLVQA
ncbi:MAG: phage major capsid protein [Phycisphaeraceae bacterium]|nr:phage major capsid protein [Phycisphaeraceae bacterium]